MDFLKTIAVALVCATVSAAELDDKPPSIEHARATRLELQWPGAVNREAFVVLQFDVLADGTVANIRVTDDGFHEKRFVDSAIAALKRAKWQPRRINGAAVDSRDISQAFRFSIPNMEPGITAEFRTEAKQVEEMLKKGDYAGGEFHAQWMLAEKVTLKYEYAILQAQLAQTYAGLGRIADAVRKLARATARSDRRPQFLQLLDAPPANKASNYLLEKELIVQLLGFRMELLAAQGLALEAMQAYYELAGLETPPPGDPLTALAARLTAQIRGTGDLRGQIEMGPEEGVWRQYLSRRRFTLEKVEGNIRHLSLDCDANSQELEYQPGLELTVPEGWGICAARIDVEPGSKFEFVEFPDR